MINLKFRPIHSYVGWGFQLALGILFLHSCQPEFKKFESPEWIEGKLFKQLQSIPGTDSFEICVRRTGFDTILNGDNFTVFSPDNKAFREYFSTHPSYASIGDMPEKELRVLVQSHIIHNPWSRDQLQRANEEGWINKRDPNNDKPWGYKRQTLYREANRKYWIQVDRDGSYAIVDSLKSKDYRIVYQPSRKYVPVFFDQYMELAGMESADFEFYFDRPFEPGYMYLAGAQLHPEDHFAENGFIFTIDRVVPPLKNVEQLLESKEAGNDYSYFRDLIYVFPRFRRNVVQTNQQEGVEEGLEVPTLYDLDYEELAFDIHEEITGYRSFDENTATRYHYGILAPTNRAFQDLIDNVLTIRSGDSTRWPSFELVPRHIKRLIINSHMSKTPIYLSDIEQGFLNVEWDTVFVDPASVVEIEYGSNATFMGINTPIVPRAFSSVTAPVYLRPQYIGFMKGVELSGLAPALKRRNADYSLYAVKVADDFFDHHTPSSALDLLLNQVGTSTPREIARKEFIPNLGGNYILYDTLRRPTQLEEPTDNGKTYAASSFNWPKKGHLFWILLSDFPAFMDLMDKAGMVDFSWWKLNFISETEYHTVFAPTDEALAKVNTDTMSTVELQQFIKYHFINGDIIFTDGNKAAGDYYTLRVDESTTAYDTRYSVLDIRPEPDRIRIHDQKGNLLCDIREHWERTNILFGKQQATYQTTGVVHAIDTVLLK